MSFPYGLLPISQRLIQFWGDEYLRKAYEHVKLVAGKTKDPELRESYLQNVKMNREILMEAKARGIAT